MHGRDRQLRAAGGCGVGPGRADRLEAVDEDQRAVLRRGPGRGRAADGDQRSSDGEAPPPHRAPPAIEADVRQLEVDHGAVAALGRQQLLAAHAPPHEAGARILGVRQALCETSAPSRTTLISTGTAHAGSVSTSVVAPPACETKRSRPRSLPCAACPSPGPARVRRAARPSTRGQQVLDPVARATVGGRRADDAVRHAQSVGRARAARAAVVGVARPAPRARRRHRWRRLRRVSAA